MLFALLDPVPLSFGGLKKHTVLNRLQRCLATWPCSIPSAEEGGRNGRNSARLSDSTTPAMLSAVSRNEELSVETLAADSFFDVWAPPRWLKEVGNSRGSLDWLTRLAHSTGFSRKRKSAIWNKKNKNAGVFPVFHQSFEYFRVQSLGKVPAKKTCPKPSARFDREKPYPNACFVHLS